MNYIRQGDCLELMKGIPEKSIDLILTDLPYGTTHATWDKKIDLEKLWKQYERVIKDNGAILLFAQNPFAAELIQSNRKLFRYEWIWQKSLGSGHLNSHKMPLKAHELILVFYKRLPVYNPQMRAGKAYKRTSYSRSKLYGGREEYTVTESVDGKRYPVDVIQFANVNNYCRTHPTEKPLDLLEYLINTYTNPGDVVLDSCMGTGNTCIAAINTGRQYIGIELDKSFYNIAKERIEEAEKTLKQ